MYVSLFQTHRVALTELTSPIPAIWRAEEEVLDNDGNEEPDDHFAVAEGSVEGIDLSRLLSIVIGESKVKHQADTPHQHSYGHTYSSTTKSAFNSQFYEEGALTVLCAYRKQRFLQRLPN